jgi:hypothetical protein
MADGSGSTTTTETGATATTGVTTPATGTVQPGAGQGGAPWYGGFDADTVGTLQAKGWASFDSPDKAIPEIVKSYKNIERLQRSDHIPLPKDLNDAEGYAKLYEKLGRPPKASDYGIKPGEGGSPEFTDKMSALLHEVGLSTAQAQKLASGYTGLVDGMKATQDHQFSTQSAADLQAIRGEWGAQSDMRFAAAQRALVQFGLDKTTAEKLEKAIGTKPFLSLFSNIGLGMSEDRGAGSGGGSGFMTPEAAQSKLNDLKADQGWRNRYLAGGAQERADYDKLIAIVAG